MIPVRNRRIWLGRPCQRRETVEHPFGTIKARMGATQFLVKRLKNVRSEMALSVLAYNLTRVMNTAHIKAVYVHPDWARKGVGT